MLPVFLLTALWLFMLVSGRCPEQCICDIDSQQRKRITCGRGGMTDIPTAKMEKGSKVLVVTAPVNNLNRLTIGRIFQEFYELEEVRITYSMLPAIGDSSFWPGKNIRMLDLSHNNITFIKDRDFFGLQNLRVLDLSYNNIAASPSAPFRLLSSLTTLSLARNRLRTLVPRFFYMLSKLEKLDLTGNPLKDIDPENMKDVKPLRRLHLAKCQISRLHSLTYQQLPNLEELDLRDNFFTYFSPEEFRHLKRLKYLHLDGNNLTIIVEKTFDGHNLRHLGLSRNRLFSLSKCAFCNLSIQQLDLSHNQLEDIPYDLLSSVAHSLESFDLSYNFIESIDLELVLSPAYKLKKLVLSGMKLKELSDEAFFNNRQLKTLDLSHNKFVNISIQTLLPLRHVEEIDLSHNEIQFLESNFFEQIQNLTTLTVLHLHSNPWSCQKCTVLSLLKWLHDSPLYSSTCDVQYESSTCMRCASPFALEGKTLHSLRRTDLEPCEDTFPQSQLLKESSNIPIIAVSSAAIVFVLGVTIGIIVYQRQGAVYYTMEGERVPTMAVPGEHIMTNGGGTLTDGKRRAFFVTLDRIDENSENKTITIKNSS